MVTKEKRMDSMMKRVLDVWGQQSGWGRNFTCAMRGDPQGTWSGPQMYLIGLYHSSIWDTVWLPGQSWYLYFLPGKTRSLPMSLISSCTTMLHVRTAPTTLSSIVFPKPTKLLPISEFILLLSYIHLDTPTSTSTSTNSSHVCLFLLTHIPAQMLPLHQFLVDF